MKIHHCTVKEMIFIYRSFFNVNVENGLLLLLLLLLSHFSRVQLCAIP